jgi:hypothetical protein
VAGYTGPEVSMKRPAFAAVLVLLTALLAGPPPAVAATTARPYDFDGNGYPDLVVGAPDLTVRTALFAGGVVVLPAFARGLSSTEKLITQSSRGVPGASETGDKFGKTLASADFDRDGYADLAVGQPRETIPGFGAAGAVTVVYGSARGLDTLRSTGITDPSGPGEAAFFGEALTTGDFNADGYPDLAVGAPSYSLPETLRPLGTVTILPGGPTGVATTGAIVLDHQAGPDFDASFGSELASGDLDQDGTADLVVGSAGAPDYGGGGYPGSVSYCLGRTGGPTGCARLFHEASMAGMTSLVVGNMVGTGRPDIVVGSPSPFWQAAGGLLLIEVEGGAPLALANVRFLSQDMPGIPGHDEAWDHFGYSLAMGDTNRDGYSDLAIGADGEDSRAGRVTVVHGGPTGWRTRGNYIYDQNTPGIPGASEPGDIFGSSVTLIDHDRDGHLDLTVGIEGENHHFGGITLLRGSGRGFTTTGARRISLTGLGYAYPAESSFGATLGG